MNGLFLVDKPAGMTSFGVVARIKRLSGQKCGHSGTLDPMATGLLPVMVGRATKLCSLLTGGQKRYIGTLRFGIETDTGDMTGKIIAEKAAAVDKAQFSALLPAFTGTLTQRPPIYSAIKVEGVPLYRHARAGRAVEVPERTVTINRLKLLSFHAERAEATLEVDCSKGTYIRTLFSDLAAAAGTCGTMTALRRTRVGPYRIEQAVPLEELMQQLERGEVPPALISLEQALAGLPQYTPEDFFATLLRNGCAVSIRKLKDLPSGLCAVYRRGELIGLGDQIERDGETCFQVVTHL